MRLARVDYIVVHCAATKPGMDIGRKEIDDWHRRRGWSGIGYHYVIRRDGVLEKGREDNRVGAHAYGYNKRSLGICMVGGVNNNGDVENNFTPRQFGELAHLLALLTSVYPRAKVLGHRDLSPDIDGDGVIEKWEWTKGCPSFDASAWWEVVSSGEAV